MKKNSEFQGVDFVDIIFDEKGNMTVFGAIVSIFLYLSLLQAIIKLKTSTKRK